MSPAPQRGSDPAEEMLQSWTTPNPTLGADLEGWLNYDTATNRWNYWDGTNWIPLALDANNQVTNANLRDSAALSVIGRSANSTGDPADIATTASSNHVLRETSVAGVRTLTFDQVGAACMATDSVETAAIKNDNVTVGKIAHHSSGPGVFCVDQTGAPEWREAANTPAYPMAKDLTSSVSWPKISGTSFPTSPVDGQIFTHTTHRCMYYYDATAAGWLSTAVFEIQYGNSLDMSGSAYVELDEASAFATYSATIGHLFNFPVKVVGISLCQAAAPAGTVVIEVWDDGVAVSGSSAQLSTAAQSDAIETLMSTTIAAKSIIAVRLLSGTAEGPFRGIVRIRRFET